MNSVIDFLLELRALGATVSVEGSQLLCTAPPGVLTADLRQRLGAHKPEILRLLAPASAPEHAADDATDTATHRLSRAQNSIWLLEQITPGASIWNVANAFEIRGALNHAALEASFRALVKRHAVLRSRFITVDGAPTVELAPHDDWAIEHVDLRGSPDAEHVALAQAMAAAQQPFDLKTGLPCRVTLLQTSDVAYVLVIVLHHIVADGWSLGVICQEFSQNYEAHVLGLPSLLPPLRADYQTFIRRAELHEATSQADVDWWREKLSGDLPHTSLAADQARVPSGVGRRMTIEIKSDIAARIESLARQHRATSFMVLLAAFKLLIYRYTGESDLLVGIASSGRDRPEYADVVGLFVNTLVLRTSITSDLSFIGLLDRVRENSLEAFARQHVPFDRVVQAVQPRRREGSFNPFSRFSFAYQNVPLPPLRLRGLEVTHVPLPPVGARQELLVEIWRTARGLTCEFEFATDLLDVGTINRLMEHYINLLEGIVADPDQRIAELPFLSDDEREQLLTGWNGTRTDYGSDRRLEELFAEQVAKTPDAVALIHRETELSYIELDRRANRLANHLASIGVGPERLVGICLERSPDLVVTILAVLKAGGAYVPLAPNYPAERLAFMLEDSTAAVLVTTSALRQSFPHTAYVVDLDTDRAAIAAQPETLDRTAATADNLAYVIYTSGSTGRPKGTMLRHSAVYLVDWARRTFTAEQISRVVAGTSISFDPSVFELFVPLCTGGAAILIENFLEPINPANQPTLVVTVPSAIEGMLLAGNIPASMRVIISGGEKLKNTLAQALYETTQVEQVYNTYGPTEYTTCATIAHVARGAQRDPPIGRPLSNTQAYILDPQHQLVPVGVIQELYLAGDGLARGYLGRSELTTERFPSNPFGPPGSRMYRTGDLARWSPEGELEFIGRADNQVKLRGFRIELGEIESALLRHEAVRDAVVVARQDKFGNPCLVAYVATADTALSSFDLRLQIGRWLPEHMIPSAFVVMSALPLNTSGKVNYAALPLPTVEPSVKAVDKQYMPPIEEIVAETFKLMLDLDDVGADSNFFDLGGYSLLAVKVASRLGHLLALPVSPAWIFQAPTPRALALLLDAQLRPPDTHLTPLQPLGTLPPVFCLHDLFSRPVTYSSFARAFAPEQPVYGVAPGPLEAAIIAQPTLDVLTPAYVAAIRSIQPHGPYFIAGYSFGGLPAFDIAHALLAENEDVLLIMIDPYIARTMPNIFQISKWAYRHHRWIIKKIHGRRKGRTAHDADVPQKELQNTVRKIRIPTWAPITRNRLEKSLLKVPGWVPTSSHRLAGSLLQAQANYRFRPFEGRTVFLQGTVRDPEQDFFNTDGLNGWGSLFSGPVTHLEVNAAHLSMMRDPVVSQVATLLRPVLARHNDSRDIGNKKSRRG